MDDQPDQDHTSYYINTAKLDFENALRKGFWRSIVSWITQTDNKLMPYDEIRKTLPLSGEHYIGLHSVPVELIIGSVGRYHDFDRAFLPLRTTTKGRWISVDRAYLESVDLPPIEVYKVGEVYFVKDGNHRVSVARERGQIYIDADVIEIDTPVPVDRDTDIDTLIRKVEQAQFLKETGLAALRPELDIDLSLPGGYKILLEHIKVHRYFLGQELDRPIKWEEAVEGWVDKVYLPLIRVIREYNILKEFPKRTEADLYLWIIEHLWYLREEYKDVSMEEAAAHFAEEYSTRPLQRLIAMVKRTARFLSDPGPEEEGDSSEKHPGT
jgi:hypothetical protein